jgi:late competence protein required for DNA uptake (superfamily II DNA/RNA helicase)
MSDLVLREYQNNAIEMLRQGFAAGHRSQLLYLGTGGGKTEIAIAMLEATKKKGNKAAMLLDRIILCEQTSQRLSNYHIEHGVMQSGHWRYRPYENIQVCSAQTLEKRGSFPGLNLLIVDECHAQRAQTIEFIKNNPEVKVIGLTATPFTKGLGKVYENVVSVVTTKQLVNQGNLVPLRVFIAKEIDMTDAKKVAGEWSQSEATTRGMKITGDIVQEWIKKTHEVFGKPRKTIIFCSGVEHGADLSKKFAEQGYNFISISYRDDDEFKRDVIEDFAKPDTEIHGLIATDILTKGFDVPDVMIGVSARPFSKSLSSHIQQMGRVMRSSEGKEFSLWLCLAKGSLVLTDSGLVPIEKVKMTHKIWDGTNFVTHGGAICNGIQEVITYQGLTATAGHLVHTAKGWRTFGECASQQIRITQTGLGGRAIRLGGDLRPTSFLAGRTAQTIYSRLVRVCDLWVQKFNFAFQSSRRKDKGLQGVQSAGLVLPDVALQQSPRDACPMLLSFKQPIPGVWGAWNRVQVLWRQTRNALDYGKSWASRIFIHYGSLAHSAGQNRPEWTLRTGQSSLAFCGIEPAKQKGEPVCRSDAQVQDRSSGNSILRQHVEAFLLGWHDGGRDSGKVQQAFSKAEREVWDILDAGSHNRFTCEGLLVHNCHSGNYLRFREDWDGVYEDGVSTLDDGKEKVKKEKTEKEKEAAKCPACHALWPSNSDTCYSCGYVRERKNKVSAVAGEMQELTGAMSRESKQEFWSGLQWYVHHQGWSPGRAAHTYKEKFGVWPRNLSDASITPTPETVKFIDSRIKAYIRKMKRSR